MKWILNKIFSLPLFKIPKLFVDVPIAKWIINSDGYYPYCSNCKSEPDYGIMSNYCPMCGAKMRKE